MRILYVAPMNSIHSVRWIEYFCQAGLDVHIVNVGLEEQHRIERATYHDEIRRPSAKRGIVHQFTRSYVPFRRGMKQLLSEIKPDLVHVHGISIYAYVIKQCGFRPVIATAWGSDVLVGPRESLKYRLIVRKVLRSVDVVTCDGDHIRKRMIDEGAASEAIEIVYFGTDVEQFNPRKRDPGLAEELGFERDASLVVSLRALGPIYDVATLIRAIPMVVRERRPVGFVIVGDGPDRFALERLCAELGARDDTRFVGRLTNADMQRYTASAAVYVSTSLSDAGLAASTAEAMASGVPPVVTDFGDNGEWVKEGVTGHLFPLRDSSALAARIVKLLEDPDAARAMGACARQVIETRNNWHNEMAKVMRLYERVAS